MTDIEVVKLLREALMVTMIVSAPILGIGMFGGPDLARHTGKPLSGPPSIGASADFLNQLGVCPDCSSNWGC